MKQRKGFTLIELMIVIAIIIILAAIAIPNYLRLTDRARRARVAGDFTSLATANEAYLVDWGHYPEGSAIDVEFGKDKMTNAYIYEITGVAGAKYNAVSETSLVGELGGIEYIKTGTLGAMYDPFIPNKGYHYACNSTGSHWVLYVLEKETPATYLSRSDMATDLVETATTPSVP
jgi:prepilin-type N-terminal cleavage/methylation domain-containing protein